MTATLDRLLGDAPADAPGRQWLRDHRWPTARDETWRYAPLAAINAAMERAPAHGGDVATLVAQLLADLPAGPRLVVVDGHYRPELSTLPTGDGLTLELEATPGPLDASRDLDGFAVANHAATPGTTRIHVGGRGDGAEPVAVHLVQVTLTGMAAQPRTEIVVGPAARLDLIETFRAAAGAGLTNASTSIELGRGARLDHLRVVQAAAATAHVGRTEIVAGADSSMAAVALTAGPGAVRHTVDTSIAGPGAVVTLTGLSVPLRGTHHDTTVSVRHRQSHGTSHQRFVAIVADGGRASFTGHVSVAAGTSGTDADQQNHNLLLGPTARADTRPWLQIDADDVACTHGATVGRLDEDAVFYLRSRGIPEAAARSMLITAFAHTALDDVLGPGAARTCLAGAVTAAIGNVLDGQPAGAPTADGERA